jgi:hypothetical protein
MLPGGSDIVLDGKTQPTDADFILRTFIFYWSKALIQLHNSDEIAPAAEYPELKGTQEYYLYKNRKGVQYWNDGLEIEDLDAAGTMVQVIVSTDQITIVVDSPKTSEIASNILQAIETDRQVTG